MVRLGRVHPYRFCPRCHSEVAAEHRFCRRCTFWLARPEIDGLRQLEGEPGIELGLLSRLRLQLQLFQASLYILLAGAVLGACGVVLVVLLGRYMIPSWLRTGAEAQVTACYSNMRIIQGALEAYCLEHRFTRELASDPVGVLHDSGFLHNVPHCPVPGNRYFIPRGATLTCIGSEGHGLPY